MKMFHEGHRHVKMNKLELELRRTGRHSSLIHYSHYTSTKATLLRP